MASEPRPWKPSRRERRVILALLSGASNLSHLSVASVAQIGLRPAVIILARLESEGWVVGERGSAPGYPRRFYRLTSHGRRLGLTMLGLEDDRGE